MMPKLLYERLDEIGIDFAIIYPTAGLRLPRIKDDETRRAVIRAYNIVSADYFHDLGDRMTPAAIIPMHHPEEAIAELEFVTSQLGSKVGMFGSGMRAPGRRAPTDASGSRRYDVLGDRQRVRLRPGVGEVRRARDRADLPLERQRPGAAQPPVEFRLQPYRPFRRRRPCGLPRAIFLGGVTRRFPELRFAFLEGGVGWACQLFGDLIEHWERRGAPALKRMDPDKLDRKLLLDLVEKHGYDDIAAALKARDGWPDPDAQDLTGGRAELDDFAACKITRKEDWIDLYAKPFYFGCEADDRMNATAFGRGNPFGAKLNAIYSSDIGHFDVIDMRDPLPEAYELVEDGRSPRTTSATSPSPTRCSCGARRTRNSSTAPSSRRKPRRNSAPAIR